MPLLPEILAASMQLYVVFYTESYHLIFSGNIIDNIKFGLVIKNCCCSLILFVLLLVSFNSYGKYLTCSLLLFVSLLFGADSVP